MTSDAIKQEMLRLAVEYGDACMAEAEAGVRLALAKQQVGAKNAAAAIDLRRLADTLPGRIEFEISFLDRALAAAVAAAPVALTVKKPKRVPSK